MYEGRRRRKGEMQKMDGVFILVLPKRGATEREVNSRYERAGSLFPVVTYHFISIERGEVRRDETVHCVIGTKGNKKT